MQYATLNVGLNGNDGTVNTLADTLESLAGAGFIVDDAKLAQSATEQTAIVTVQAVPNAHHIIGAAYLACGILKQDCIAVKVLGVGFIVGPNAVKWGEFNPSYFLE